jgi:hypothetical protein
MEPMVGAKPTIGVIRGQVRDRMKDRSRIALRFIRATDLVVASASMVNKS